MLTPQTITAIEVMVESARAQVAQDRRKWWRRHKSWAYEYAQDVPRLLEEIERLQK